YAEKVYQQLRERRIRVELDDRNEKIGYKIRYARQVDKVPYMLILGEKEVAENNLSVRDRATDQTQVMTLDEFAEKLLGEVKEKK
ncbi:MAG: threonine--tRNA ligase, partial [Clostridia bacterium]|nr:threonine--tRNA ligase [Clostridia bacterium]